MEKSQLSREVSLKDGRQVRISCAMPNDAAQLLDYSLGVFSDAEFFVTQPGEFKLTLEQEIETVKKALDNPGELILLARAEDAIVGTLLSLSNNRKRTAHTSTLHLTVRGGWRGVGMGTALLQTLIDWAVETGALEKLCLSVFSSNHRAVALYRRMGFIEEGRRSKQYKTAPGEYADEVLMSRFM